MAANVIIQQGGFHGLGLVNAGDMTPEEQALVDSLPGAPSRESAGVPATSAIGSALNSFFSFFGSGAKVTEGAGAGFNAAALALIQGDAARGHARSTAVVLGVVGLLAVGGLVAWQVGKK